MIQRLRRAVLPRLDGWTRSRLGKYLAYQLDPAELVGTRSGVALERVIDDLRERGYAYNGLSAAKRHPDDRSVVDAGSYRRVPDAHPDVDARIVEAWAPRQCQYHVHLFRGPSDAVELYSHYELRPDLFGPGLSFERLRTHYRPGPGEYVTGVADEELSEYLDRS